MQGKLKGVERKRTNDEAAKIPSVDVKTMVCGKLWDRHERENLASGRVASEVELARPFNRLL